MEELIDEIDAQGNFIAARPKDSLKQKMFMHRASLVIPRAKGGKVLLALRSKNKHPYPGTWCCAVGGKARSGESEEEAALREMKEEVGKTFPLEKVTSFVYDDDTYKAVFSVFTTTKAISPEELTLDSKEVERTKAFFVPEILEMAQKNPKSFAPTFISAIKEFSKHFK